MKWMMLPLLATAAVAAAQGTGTLSLTQIVQQGYLTHLECSASLGRCIGTTPLAPNALAAALGLPTPNQVRERTDTGGRGWRVQQEELTPELWFVILQPLGRNVRAAEVRAYPPVSQTLQSMPQTQSAARPGPAASSPRPEEGGSAARPELAAARGTLGVPRKSAPPPCTVVIDVRGLGRLERGMTSFVLDSQGAQLWPDRALVKGVGTGLIREGNLHTYITSEQQISGFKNVTRVKASALLAPRQSPKAAYKLDVALGPNAAKAFRAAGQGCAVVYLQPKP